MAVVAHDVRAIVLHAQIPESLGSLSYSTVTNDCPRETGPVMSNHNAIFYRLSTEGTLVKRTTTEAARLTA
jgi:hypothetical protein